MFITLMRGWSETGYPEDSSEEIVEEVYSRGNCGNFAKALVLAFGGKVVKVRCISHVVAVIEDKLYDITGDVTHRYSKYGVEDIPENELSDYVNNYSFIFRGPII